jgi:hypothetical protein
LTWDGLNHCQIQCKNMSYKYLFSPKKKKKQPFLPKKKPILAH